MCTDFFPIWRSERKSKSELEKEKMEGIEARLLATEDTGLDLEVREIYMKGRGVVTLRSYEKGEFVIEYAGELIDQRQGDPVLPWHYQRMLSQFFLSTVFLFSTVIGTLFHPQKCFFVELRHRMIKSCLFLVRNCLLSKFNSIVGSKLIYRSVWRTLRMKRQTVSSDMKSKRMIKNEGPLKRRSFVKS